MCVEESIMNNIVIFVFNFRLFLLSHFVEKKLVENQFRCEVPHMHNVEK